jgi:predicted glycosyltransferase
MASPHVSAEGQDRRLDLGELIVDLATGGSDGRQYIAEVVYLAQHLADEHQGLLVIVGRHQ